MKENDFLSIPNVATYGRGYVYSLQYHIVWCTKYRKPVLNTREHLIKNYTNKEMRRIRDTLEKRKSKK